MDMTPIAGSAFAGLLERATGQQLVAGRRWRIEAALGPVMRAHAIDSLDRLAMEIGRDEGSPLAVTVVEALLNNETSFFRDAAVNQANYATAIRALLARRVAEGRRVLRVWSAGCSTGQEAYTFAIGMSRTTGTLQDCDLRVVGSDISGEAIARARLGLYSQAEVQRGLPIRDLLDHFDPDGDNWRVKPATRGRCTFVHHNLFAPPPGRNFDIVMCRNVLLYFVEARRRQVFERLAEAIAPDGLLMLGAGETVMESSQAFEADAEHRGLYRRRDVQEG